MRDLDKGLDLLKMGVTLTRGRSFQKLTEHYEKEPEFSKTSRGFTKNGRSFIKWT